METIIVCENCGEKLDENKKSYFKNFNEKVYCSECFLSQNEPEYSRIHLSYPQPFLSYPLQKKKE